MMIGTVNLINWPSIYLQPFYFLLQDQAMHLKHDKNKNVQKLKKIETETFDANRDISIIEWLNKLY